MIDTAARKSIATAVAKAIAYRNTGNKQMADAWAAELVALLGAADIMAPSIIESHSRQARNGAFD